MRYKMNDYDQQQMKGKAKIEQKKLQKKSFFLEQNYLHH